MTIVLGIIGMTVGVLLIKYREWVGEMIGDADWMRYVGGVYNFIIIVGVFLFFYSAAAMTGTTKIFLAPLMLLFPFAKPPPDAGGF